MELSRLATQVITKDDAAFEEALRALRGTGVSVLQVNENS
jgi:ABC-type hemin transport system substrate-binding protein